MRVESQLLVAIGEQCAMNRLFEDFHVLSFNVLLKTSCFSGSIDITKESKRGSGTTVWCHLSLTRSSVNTSSVGGPARSQCRLAQAALSAIDECLASEKRNVEGAVGSEEKMGVGGCALKEQGRASEDELGTPQVDKKCRLDIG